MAVLKNAFANGTRQMPVPNGSEVVAVRCEYAIGAVLAITDQIVLGSIPANCRVVDYIIDSDDLSSTSAGTFDLGILTDAATPAIDTTASGGAAWVAGSTLMQAGGIERSLNVRPSRSVVNRTRDRLFGLVMTAACTATTTGTIAVTLFYIAA